MFGAIEGTMLTRLKVSGFKNLVDVDISFGPFTCIAGPNGVGKSNLFDAIRFLSALADHPLIDAALSVRDDTGRSANVRSLFYKGGAQLANEMHFEAEMIIPAEGTDDLGQKAEAAATFLRYSLTLAYREDPGRGLLGGLELIREELTHITSTMAPKHLLFPHKARLWRNSVVQGHRTAPFISTVGKGPERQIKLHQDGTSGKPQGRLAVNLPRTVLSAANASESKTALLARREMQSWRLMQLEPAALRTPDEYSSPTSLSPDGSHLPATVYRLARRSSQDPSSGEDIGVYARIANRLSDLIEDVRSITVDRDERRQLLTLCVEGRDGTFHEARALSDGTLRFLALAVLEQDPEAQGVLCLEEPENGIHPERIPAMLRLLEDIATDVELPIGPDNPLRQVIINTHSPSVVKQVPETSLLVAESRELILGDQRVQAVSFCCLPNDWRTKRQGADSTRVCTKGKLLAYLNPELPPEPEEQGTGQGKANGGRLGNGAGRKRVIDRKDIQELLPFESS
jgi:predicted ATPase